MGTQIRRLRSRGVSRRPRHKSANRGDRRPQRRNNMDGNQRPPSATSDPATITAMVDVATGCPNRRPHTQRRGGARYRPPPRRPTTHGTPSSPVTIYRSHAVTLPAATTAVFTFGFGTQRSPNSRTVTESTCCTRGTDTAFCRHRYTQETGQPYTWVHDPTTPMADLPEWLAERTHTGTRRPGGH